MDPYDALDDPYDPMDDARMDDQSASAESDADATPQLSNADEADDAEEGGVQDEAREVQEELAEEDDCAKREEDAWKPDANVMGNFERIIRDIWLEDRDIQMALETRGFRLRDFEDPEFSTLVFRKTPADVDVGPISWKNSQQLTLI